MVEYYNDDVLSRINASSFTKFAFYEKKGSTESRHVHKRQAIEQSRVPVRRPGTDPAERTGPRTE